MARAGGLGVIHKTCQLSNEQMKYKVKRSENGVIIDPFWLTQISPQLQKQMS